MEAEIISSIFWAVRVVSVSHGERAGRGQGKSPPPTLPGSKIILLEDADVRGVIEALDPLDEADVCGIFDGLSWLDEDELVEDEDEVDEDDLRALAACLC